MYWILLFNCVHVWTHTLSIFWFISYRDLSGVGQAASKIWELRLGLSYAQWRFKYLTHYLLPPRDTVIVMRDENQSQNLEFPTWNVDILGSYLTNILKFTDWISFSIHSMCVIGWNASEKMISIKMDFSGWHFATRA